MNPVTDYSFKIVQDETFYFFFTTLNSKNTTQEKGDITEKPAVYIKNYSTNLWGSEYPVKRFLL